MREGMAVGWIYSGCLKLRISSEIDTNRRPLAIHLVFLLTWVVDAHATPPLEFLVALRDTSVK